jgi:hypothetical protein
MTDEEIKALAELHFGTDIGSHRGGPVRDLEADRKAGYFAGYKAAMKGTEAVRAHYQAHTAELQRQNAVLTEIIDNKIREIKRLENNGNS